MFCPSCKLEYRPGFTHCNDCDVDLVDALPQADADPASQAGARDLRAPLILRSGVSAADAQLMRNALNDAGVVFNERRAATELVADGSPTYEFWVNAEDRPNAVSVIAAALQESESSETTDSVRVLWGGDDRDFFNQLCIALIDKGVDCYKYEVDARHPSAFSRNPYEVSVRPEDFVPATEVLESVKDDAALLDEDAPPPAHLPADAEPEDEVDDVSANDYDNDVRTAEVWSGDTEAQAETLKFCLREVGITCRFASAAGRTRLLVVPEQLDRAKEVIREVVEGAQSE